MNTDDIIRMAREAGKVRPGVEYMPLEVFERFAKLVAAAEREKVAHWMIDRSYATGHGETTEDLLAELDWQIAENWNRAMLNGVETEREACAKVCEHNAAFGNSDERHASRECALLIRERGAP